MWTSEQPNRRPRPAQLRRALEALGLAAALAFLPELARTRAGLAFEPHPGWIAVLILAARDGTGGLFAGLVASALALGVASAVAGTELASSWSGLDSGSNLVAFGACLAVSWVASWHLRRQADLGERVGVLSGRAAGADATIEALREVITTLRARVDRTSASLSFLRNVAARLEGRDPVAAAEGAADLALVRTGARAAAVNVGMNGSTRVLAVRDARGPKALAPLELHEADLTVPIRNGSRIGAIALWGIPGHELDDATAHDLEIIASWCVRALASTARHHEGDEGARRAG